MDLETRRASTQNTKYGTQNARRASIKNQQPYSIDIGRDRRTIKSPIWYGFEDLISYALITSSRDPKKLVLIGTHMKRSTRIKNPFLRRLGIAIRNNEEFTIIVTIFYNTD